MSRTGFLSDENMMKICHEGRPAPINRLDLMMMTPINTSGVYYRPTGKAPRFERPNNVASLILNKARATGQDPKKLMSDYVRTLEEIRQRPRVPPSPLGKAPSRMASTLTYYTPDITDEILEALANAQLFVPEVPEVGAPQTPETPFGLQEGLFDKPPGSPPSPMRPLIIEEEMPPMSEDPDYRGFDFPVGFEPRGLTRAPLGSRPEMTAIERGRQEMTRRQKEAGRGRPVRTILSGERGRPTGLGTIEGVPSGSLAERRMTV